MRRFILAATAIAVLSVPALAPALASADVAHTSECPITMHATLTADLQSPNYRHHWYNIDVNPCNGRFSGTGFGSWNADGSGVFSHETITGSFDWNRVTFVASYAPSDGFGNYQWKVTNAPLGAQVNERPEGIPTITTLSHVTISFNHDGDRN